MASQNAEVILCKSSCSMCLTTKMLFCALGVNPAVYNLDHEPGEREVETVLARLQGDRPPVQAVFIGCELKGSTIEVMALHVRGDLNPNESPAWIMELLKIDNGY